MVTTNYEALGTGFDLHLIERLVNGRKGNSYLLNLLSVNKSKGSSTTYYAPEVVVSSAIVEMGATSINLPMSLDVLVYITERSAVVLEVNGRMVHQQQAGRAIPRAKTKTVAKPRKTVSPAKKRPSAKKSPARKRPTKKKS